ncbi:tyrosine-protein phosphatase [Variovorax sp. M-6]|uniref:tyrosine-protein phosphatase n=1 Tax=Variovorax sp. M-6 TaxID=3233041 RepID=UPI003F9CCF8D
MTNVNTGAPARHLALAGAPNFRDLGGYVTASGKHLRWRQIFRTNALGSDLPAHEQSVLREIGLGTVCDLRGVAEREHRPTQLAGVRVLHLPIEPSIVARLQDAYAEGQTPTADFAREAMMQSYRNLVLRWSPVLREMFQVLLATEHPLAFHCTAGKDRTGLVAALILSALDVPRATVLQDYLLSQQYWRETPRAIPGIPAEVFQVVNGVDAEFLCAAFDVIDTVYGGMAPYLQMQLGLGAAECNALRRRYLES